MKPAWAVVLPTTRVNHARIRASISFRHRLQDEAAISVYDGMCRGRLNIDQRRAMIPTTRDRVMWITGDNAAQSRRTTFYCRHVPNRLHYACTHCKWQRDKQCQHLLQILSVDFSISAVETPTIFGYHCPTLLPTQVTADPSLFLCQSFVRMQDPCIPYIHSTPSSLWRTWLPPPTLASISISTNLHHN